MKAYFAWKADPTPVALNEVVRVLTPILHKALQTYAPKQEGKILLGKAKILAIRAVRTYDPKSGAKLETHVMSQLQSLRRYAASSSTALKKSERYLQEYQEMKRQAAAFYEEHGRDPSDTELCDRMGISLTKLRKLRLYEVREIGTSQASGINEEDSDESGSEVSTNSTDPQEIWLDYVYHDLSPIDQKILDWKMGMHGQPILSNQEIAKKLGITPSAVTQRAAKISRQLEEVLNLKPLEKPNDPPQSQPGGSPVGSEGGLPAVGGGNAVPESIGEAPVDAPEQGISPGDHGRRVGIYEFDPSEPFRLRDNPPGVQPLGVGGDVPERRGPEDRPERDLWNAAMFPGQEPERLAGRPRARFPLTPSLADPPADPRSTAQGIPGSEQWPAPGERVGLVPGGS